MLQICVLWTIMRHREETRQPRVCDGCGKALQSAFVWMRLTWIVTTQNKISVNSSARHGEQMATKHLEWVRNMPHLTTNMTNTPLRYLRQVYRCAVKKRGQMINGYSKVAVSVACSRSQLRCQRTQFHHDTAYTSYVNSGAFTSWLNFYSNISINRYLSYPLLFTDTTKIWVAEAAATGNASRKT